jgi:hypothetical protein
VTRRRLALAVLVLGLVGSQAGHLLAFQLRFGSAAQHLQSSGAHAYFPALAKATLGTIATGLLAALVVIGMARMLSRGSGARAVAAPKYIELLAALFTIQLVCFVSQEVGESLFAGVASGSAPSLLLWGSLGQLPVAAIGAIAIRWLTTRFESAVTDLRAGLALSQAEFSAIPVVFAQWPVSDRALLLSHVAGGSLDKRGPPSSCVSATS